jgi:formate-dependent nitrite reductase membrane component NrfD
MSDTFFTATPHWTWWILLYFFIGGIAGTAFLLASLLDWAGRRPPGASRRMVTSHESRVTSAPAAVPLVRYGYYLAFIGVLISGFLLTIDLNRPLRFWHMLIENHTGRPMFKPWEPMSVGSWGLLIFGIFSFLATLGALGDDFPKVRPLQSAVVRSFRRPVLWMIIAVLGTISGLFIAGYTGVLLAVTNRPVWADSHLLGLLFLVSGGSTGAAALILLAVRRRVADPGAVGWLVWFDRNVLIIELLVLIAFLISLGSVARIYFSWWGLLLLLGVIGAGMVVPWLMEREGTHAPRQLVRSASLVLLGGFLLRMVVLLSSDQIQVIGSGVTGR